MTFFIIFPILIIMVYIFVIKPIMDSHNKIDDLILKAENSNNIDELSHVINEFVKCHKHFWHTSFTSKIFKFISISERKYNIFFKNENNIKYIPPTYYSINSGS